MISTLFSTTTNNAGIEIILRHATSMVVLTENTNLCMCVYVYMRTAVEVLNLQLCMMHFQMI